MKARVLSGLDQISTIDALLKGKRIGLMTNPTGFDRSFRSAIDILHGHYNLTALFACEHGVRGDRQNGDIIENHEDPETGVMVYSCYGQENRRLTPEMLEAFDIFVYDMQNVGSRFYTYLFSLSYAMEACAQAGKPVVVLDRLNPVGGAQFAGTLLDERFHSFVGEYAMPTRYGLTNGEYALWVKQHLGLKLELTVVPLKGWTREMYLDDTDTPWIAPSPNCGTQQAAIAFVGHCIFEGTNLSEGRGTTTPFEVVGAPYVDMVALEKRMAKLDLPGIHYTRICFTPMFNKHQNQACYGVQMHITDRKLAEPFAAGLLLLEEIRSLHPNDCQLLVRDINPNMPSNYPIDRLLGTDSYSSGRMDARQLIAHHKPLVEDFKKQVQPLLLYR